MPIRRRRLLAAVIVAGIGGAAAVAAAVAAAAGDGERVAAFRAVADFRGDGPVVVAEAIDYDFGVQARHGIYRDIPDVATGVEITVSSPTAPDPVEITVGTLGETTLKIGSALTTITGRHRYLITYGLERRAVERDGRVAWDAVGFGWTVPIDEVEIHIVSDRGLGSPTCRFGNAWDERECSVTEIEPGHLLARVDHLAAGEGVTVSAFVRGELDAAPAVPTLPSGPAPDPGAGILRPALLAMLGVLVGAVPATVVVRRLGREQVWAGGAVAAAHGPADDNDARVPVEYVDEAGLARLATVEFEPPRDMSAVEGGLVLREKVGTDLFTAWLLEAAIRGEIELDRDGSTTVLRRGTATPPPGVAPILSTLFGSHDSIRLDGPKKNVRKGWTRLQRELHAWQRHSELWDPRSHRRRSTGLAAGVLIGLVGAAVTLGGAAGANRWGGSWLVVLAAGAVVLGAGVATAVNAFELLIRSPAGSARWLRVESFRRFLHDSEADHVTWAAERGLLREYTAWAIAVGEADAWTAAVARAAADQPDLARSFANDLAFVSLGSSLTSSVGSAVASPSSGGGGGGFGGGVGGGGGGGGGGSW